MQTSKLLMSVILEIDRVSCNCVWRSDNQARKIHLINWEIVRKPIKRGGMALRQAKAINMVLMVKLGWRLIQNPEATWSQLLRARMESQDKDMRFS